MIPDTSHLFRQLELAFCPNKEWEKKGSAGAGGAGKTERESGGLGRVAWQTSEGVRRGGLRSVLGKRKVQVEGVGRQNQRGAETRVKEDDRNFNIKRKSVKDECSSRFLCGQSKLGWETNGV